MADHAKATVLEARNAPNGAPVTPRRVVVVDDHRTFADLLQFALNAEDGLCCVGVAYDPATGLALVASERPDLVVMDYDFAGDELDGVMATAAITARHPDVHVVLLTGHADSILMQQAAEAGASLVDAEGRLAPGSPGRAAADRARWPAGPPDPAPGDQGVRGGVQQSGHPAQPARAGRAGDARDRVADRSHRGPPGHLAGTPAGAT